MHVAFHFGARAIRQRLLQARKILIDPVIQLFVLDVYGQILPTGQRGGIQQGEDRKGGAIVCLELAREIGNADNGHRLRPRGDKGFVPLAQAAYIIRDRDGQLLLLLFFCVCRCRIGRFL